MTTNKYNVISNNKYNHNNKINKNSNKSNKSLTTTSSSTITKIVRSTHSQWQGVIKLNFNWNKPSRLFKDSSWDFLHDFILQKMQFHGKWQNWTIKRIVKWYIWTQSAPSLPSVNEYWWVISWIWYYKYYRYLEVADVSTGSSKYPVQIAALHYASMSHLIISTIYCDCWKYCHLSQNQYIVTFYRHRYGHLWQIQILSFVTDTDIDTSVRRSSRSAFGRSTGNDVSGHYKRHSFLFFPFFFSSPSSTFLIEGVLI